MIPTPPALLTVLTWMALPDVFEAQVPNPEIRAQIQELLLALAKEAGHATNATQALILLADALTAWLSPEELKKIAGGL
jgi:hypothetical protein